jgi:hypothetical protein
MKSTAMNALTILCKKEPKMLERRTARAKYTLVDCRKLYFSRHFGKRRPHASLTTIRKAYRRRKQRKPALQMMPMG